MIQTIYMSHYDTITKAMNIIKTKRNAVVNDKTKQARLSAYFFSFLKFDSSVAMTSLSRFI